MRFILILLLLFFGCDDSPTGPSLDLCGVVGGNDINEDGYHCGDLQVLQDIIDANPSLEGQNPLEFGIQNWAADEDGRLTYLTILYSNPEVYDSSIDYQLTSVPESIGDLSALLYLSIIGNQLMNIPESIGDLNNLVRLHLHRNELTSLPENICNLPSSCDIDVHTNNLCEEYHYECISEWDLSGLFPQDQSNCCEGPEGQENWTTCP